MLIFRIWPTVGFALVTIFAGHMIFRTATHDHAAFGQVVGAAMIALGIFILFSLLRFVCRALRGFL